MAEPEAASYFTARDKQESGIEILEVSSTHLAEGIVIVVSPDERQVDDCFILVDAGGGTVDVVSYQVTKVRPNLELKAATAPTSKSSPSMGG